MKRRSRGCNPAINLAYIGILTLPGSTPNGPQPSFSRLWWHVKSLTPEQWANGRRWYADAVADLAFRADEFGVDLDLIVVLAAVLTPGLRWRKTLTVLDMLLSAHRRHEPDFPKTGDATFGFRDRAKAWEILQTGDRSLCTGAKVEPFARALAGDGSAIVVDRHLVRLATGAETNQLQPAAMERIRASMRVIAWALGEEPAAIQAALWETKAGTEVPAKPIDGRAA